MIDLDWLVLFHLMIPSPDQWAVPQVPTCVPRRPREHEIDGNIRCCNVLDIRTTNDLEGSTTTTPRYNQQIIIDLWISWVLALPIPLPSLVMIFISWLILVVISMTFTDWLWLFGFVDWSLIQCHTSRNQCSSSLTLLSRASQPHEAMNNGFHFSQAVPFIGIASMMALNIHWYRYRPSEALIFLIEQSSKISTSHRLKWLLAFKYWLTPL